MTKYKYSRKEWALMFIRWLNDSEYKPYSKGNSEVVDEELFIEDLLATIPEEDGKCKNCKGNGCIQCSAEEDKPKCMYCGSTETDTRCMERPDGYSHFFNPLTKELIKNIRPEKQQGSPDTYKEWMELHKEDKEFQQMSGCDCQIYGVRKDCPKCHGTRFITPTPSPRGFETIREIEDVDIYKDCLSGEQISNNDYFSELINSLIRNQNKIITHLSNK